MTKVNGNGGDKTNLEALKAYYESLNARKTDKEEKTQSAKPVVNFKTEKVEASALDATAAQIWGVQLSKVDKSEAATTKRLEQAFANAPFMSSLNDLQGINAADDFSAFAMANLKSVDPDKLARYLNKPLGEETAAGVTGFLDALV